LLLLSDLLIAVHFAATVLIETRTRATCTTSAASTKGTRSVVLEEDRHDDQDTDRGAPAGPDDGHGLFQCYSCHAVVVSFCV
jgi:hypothetical protein